jgi:regulator of protease activity HflC (stomatin/prohibitin superfamily)
MEQEGERGQSPLHRGLEKEKLLASAIANADLLRANAEAEANRINQEAKINGIALLFSAAGITNQEEMMALT